MIDKVQFSVGRNSHQKLNQVMEPSCSSNSLNTQSQIKIQVKSCDQYNFFDQGKKSKMYFYTTVEPNFMLQFTLFFHQGFYVNQSIEPGLQSKNFQLNNRILRDSFLNSSVQTPEGSNQEKNLVWSSQSQKNLIESSEKKVENKQFLKCFDSKINFLSQQNPQQGNYRNTAFSNFQFNQKKLQSSRKSHSTIFNKFKNFNNHAQTENKVMSCKLAPVSIIAKNQIRSDQVELQETEEPPENARKNLSPRSMYQAAFLYLFRRQKSLKITKKLFQKIPKPNKKTSYLYTIKRYFQYLNLLKQKLTYYPNQDQFSLMREIHDPHCSSFALEEQMYYNKISRILVKYFVQNQLLATILQKQKIQNQSTDLNKFYLKNAWACRQVRNQLRSSFYC